MQDEMNVGGDAAHAGGADAVQGGGDGSPSGVESDVQPEALSDPTELKRQLGDQQDRYLRLAAEYDNYRKRVVKERQEVGPRAQADLIKQLIDSLDDLARVAHIDPSVADVAAVVQGVDLVEKKLLKTLTSAGLELVNPVDQPFNPELHEAVGTEPALSPEDDHMVSRVYQQGYVFKGQLLRPARVVVKQWNG